MDGVQSVDGQPELSGAAAVSEADVLRRMTSFTAQYIRSSCIAALICLVPALTSAVECSTIQFQQLRSTVCRVDLRTDRVRLFLNDPNGAPFNSFRRIAQSLAAQDEQLVFAMNAGMYREDYSPVGLLVLDGRQIHRLNLASGFGNFYMKPNGVFVLSASGAHIVETSQYHSLRDPAVFATQSGPLLLLAGQVNTSLNPQGTSRLIRNGVGVSAGNAVLFAISENPVSFYEFALLFRDRLGCQDALYLDGNVSSLYAQSLGRDDERVPLGPIVGVTVPKRP
jgi:uncharacterized protein YigE (DUF2233 family)